MHPVTDTLYGSIKDADLINELEDAIDTARHSSLYNACLQREAGIQGQRQKVK